MGSKSSKSKNSQDKEIKELKLKPEFWGSYNYDETFSTSQNTQSEENSGKTLKEKKCPFKFEWKGNGKSVLLAGSFLDNWNNIKVMTKNNDTETFERVVYLPKAKHQFKFIVDNKWVCSNQYPTIADERGIINNYIDLTNYFPKENNSEKNQKKNFYFNINLKNNEYSTKLPLFYELNMTAPNIIEHYRPLFNLNYQSNQSFISKKKYLKYKEKNLVTENNTYKKILVFPHEKLMHICPCVNDLNLSEENKNNNYIKICTTIRNKHKFLTTVYYKPKEII